MYTTAHCFKCKMTKKYLAEKGIVIEERLVDQNEDYLNEMRKMNILSVPVLVCEEMIVTDNSKAEIDKMIEYAKEAI